MQYITCLTTANENAYIHAQFLRTIVESNENIIHLYIRHLKVTGWFETLW